jgi:hypothetical protein
MNRNFFIIVALGLAAVVMAACKSPPVVTESATPTLAEIDRSQDANNVDTQSLRSTVLDWSNRTVGEDSVPLWLKPLIKGNSGPVKSEFGINPTSRVDYSIAQRSNRDEARVQAGLLFNAKIANALKTYVVTGAAQILNEAQMDIVEDITTATKINITGNERVADFWQLVETEDPSTRVKTREYVYYVTWAMPASTWTALTRKYLNDVIGKIPDRQVQTNLANAYNDIQAAADRETEMTDAEFQQRLRLQEQAAKDAQAREIARINQKGAATSAAAQVAETQVQAEARARYAAYKYGDPATAAAAATTAGDIDWISALGTAASVVF